MGNVGGHQEGLPFPMGGGRGSDSLAALLAAIQASEDEDASEKKGPTAPPSENKNLKEILPYSPEIQKFITNSIKNDIVDDFPNLHHPLADFYEEVPFNFSGNGKYTGWVMNNQPNGRGTWVKACGKMRIDGLWKDGKQHGLSRLIDLEEKPANCWQGFFDENSACAGSDRFESTGKRSKWNEILHRWTPI